MKQDTRDIISAELDMHRQDVEAQLEEEARQDAAMAAQAIEDAEESARRRLIINGTDPDTGHAYETRREYIAAVKPLRPLELWERRHYDLQLSIIEDNEHWDKATSLPAFATDPLYRGAHSLS